MTFTGHPLVGEGLDGCSRTTLDFLVSFSPDAALLLDCNLLFYGLQHGQWVHRSMSEVMVSTLAVGMMTETVPSDANVLPLLSHEEAVVATALSVVPESKNFQLLRLLKGNFLRQLSEHRSFAPSELPEVILRMNRLSGFLFMVRDCFLGLSA